MCKRREDMVGKRFGRLVVVRELEKRLMPDGKTWRRQYECLCDCGRTCVHTQNQLVTNHTSSCGCLFKKYNDEYKTIKSRLYKCWTGMKMRGSGHSPQKHVYGHVDFCEEWREFENFREWALANGYADNLTIDRIDNSKGYCPSNCRWADKRTQTLNRRQTLIIDGEYAKDVFDKRHTAKIGYEQFRVRYFKLGWSLEDSLHRPPLTHKYKNKE